MRSTTTRLGIALARPVAQFLTRKARPAGQLHARPAALQQLFGAGIVAIGWPALTFCCNHGCNPAAIVVSAARGQM
jgi:hypothetical protein